MRNLTDQANSLYAALKDQLALTWQQPGPAFQNADAASMLCQDALQALKECFDRHPPCMAEEMINFFKAIKPLFVAEQLYYNKLYLVHTRWPPGGEEAEREYLRGWLLKGYRFFEEHKDFCIYYRSGRTDHDAYYFVPGKRAAWQIPPDGFWNVTDSFTSGYDMIAGRILANERLQEYLEEQLAAVVHEKYSSNAPAIGKRQVPWTGNITDLVELLYAIDESGNCKNGNATLVTIAAALEDAFMVNLGNFARIWVNIRSRKTGNPSFMERLLAYFKRRYDRDDK